MSSEIHQVAIKKQGAGGSVDWNVVARDVFQKMPGPEQIQLVLAGDVKFYNAAGDTVPASQAIKSIGLM
ncbi:MAG: hypothetical protein JKY24_07505 [Pseudomonadales bacterium]|nr:hypothetical protein [Pseudomonadales bacterium]